MFTVYLIVTILTVAANIFSATCDFIRYEKVSIAMAKAGVPGSWMTTLGVLKTAGALGLLVGIDVPVIGIAAAVGLIVFFAGAIIIHLRGHDYSLGPTFLYDEHDHWRSGSQGRSASFCHPVLREDRPAA